MRIAIRRNGVFAAGTQAQITCTEGVLWITEAGDGRDHILFPGGIFRSSGTGTVLVEARRDAVAVIAPLSFSGEGRRLEEAVSGT